MPRRKVPRELITSRRARATAFAKRREGIRKKAHELSTLCGVRVAVVCADGEGGAAAADVWESEEGVLAAYRALPAGARAAHTHRAYAAAELGKEAAKLARVRQGGPPALPRWDAALDGASLEEATRVRDAIDAALAAVEERRRALGMPDRDDDEDLDGHDAVLEGVAPLGHAAPPSDFVVDATDQGDGDASGAGRYEPAMWGTGVQVHPRTAPAMPQPHAYGFHQYPIGGGGGGAGMDGYQQYQLPMAAGVNGYSDTTRLAWNSAAFQPRSSAVPAQQFYGAVSGYYSQHPGPSSSNVLPHLAMWGADEPHNAIVPAAYPSLDLGLSYIDSAQGNGAGASFINSGPPPALSHAMGTGDNFSNPAPALATFYGGYATTQWPSAQQQQQLQSASSSQQSDIEQLNYFSDDVEDAKREFWGN